MIELVSKLSELRRNRSLQTLGQLPGMENVRKGVARGLAGEHGGPSLPGADLGCWRGGGASQAPDQSLLVAREVKLGLLRDGNVALVPV